MMKDDSWKLPLLLQAPMAGVSTPEMAAAVTRAGGLGGLAIGHLDPQRADQELRKTSTLCNGAPLNVNLFCHAPPTGHPERETKWLEALSPSFSRLESQAPQRLETPYRTFREDPEMLAVLLKAPPAVVSFHFGLPTQETIRHLKQAGCFLMASVTDLEEGRAVECAGLDAVIAQGFEAGGHRSCFDPSRYDDASPTLVLVRRLVAALRLPVVAAGGLMDGASLAAALASGASAGQFGTAYVVCPESSAEPAHKRAILEGAAETAMTRAISGRPARCLRNDFTDLELPDAVPDYPRAYSVGKALHAAAKLCDESGYGAQWAGQGASLARSLPAEELTRLLLEELREADSTSRKKIENWLGSS